MEDITISFSIGLTVALLLLYVSFRLNALVIELRFQDQTPENVASYFFIERLALLSFMLSFLMIARTVVELFLELNKN